jgi:hypothetical protein
MNPTLTLRHTLATLAYRAAKALRGMPRDAAGFRMEGTDTRTPIEILAHMGDLFDWALSHANGTPVWNVSKPLEWDAEVARFFAALAKFDERLASPEPISGDINRLFQGPIADALTHTGQIAILRRMAGAPVKGENYYVAKIAEGQMSLDQPSSVREF